MRPTRHEKYQSHWCHDRKDIKENNMISMRWILLLSSVTVVVCSAQGERLEIKEGFPYLILLLYVSETDSTTAGSRGVDRALETTTPPEAPRRPCVPACQPPQQFCHGRCVRGQLCLGAPCSGSPYRGIGREEEEMDSPGDETHAIDIQIPHVL